jgi:hypothetical protein
VRSAFCCSVFRALGRNVDPCLFTNTFRKLGVFRSSLTRLINSPKKSLLLGVSISRKVIVLFVTGCP